MFAPELSELISGLLLLKIRGELESEFVARFQQLTGPAMAKGVEDTVFYCLNRFASINEVGGDPGKFGVNAKELHKFFRKQKNTQPHSMLASSTHDTKRSEDIRARLNLLSEIPDEWRAAVLRWSKLNGRYRRNDLPDRNMEYLFYQTLASAWPISLERILVFMEKASCEARQHTNWDNRNSEYDAALKIFVTEAMADENYKNDFEKFIASLTEGAQINSLAQTLIKLTAPGVPDIYQGCELLDYSLVDPDNRRPVDFELRWRLLTEAKKHPVDKIWKRRGEGLPKIWLIHKTLKLRACKKNLFDGDYRPLFPCGKKAKHIVAFMRCGGAITIVPRLVLGLKNWGNTFMDLPRGQWRNEFTGEIFTGPAQLSKLLKKFPVALLVEKEGD
jgi:(1->4)-alpha-D-glucan 1-alpha-D-glucosylmutase